MLGVFLAVALTEDLPNAASTAASYIVPGLVTALSSSAPVDGSKLLIIKRSPSAVASRGWRPWVRGGQRLRKGAVEPRPRTRRYGD
jgi:hypothetical protein